MPHHTLFWVSLLCLVGTCYGAAETRGDKFFGSTDLFEDLKQEITKAAHAMVHTRAEGSKVTMPVEIRIVLVGLASNGAYSYRTNADALQKDLNEAMAVHCPAILETGQQADVCFKVNFVVVEARQGLDKVDDALSTALMGRYSAAQQSGTPEFVVEATEIEPAIATLLTDTFRASDPGRDPSAALLRNTLVVLSLDKRKMAPNPRDPDMTGSHEGYRYGYSYNGVGRTAAWLARDSYAVVDLSAGPCAFGPKGLDGATATALPRVADMARMVFEEAQQTRDEAAATAHADTVFRERMITVLTEAARMFFLADMRWEHVERAERLLVPLLVLRDHDDFDPLQPGHGGSVDWELLARQAARLMGPRTQLVMTKGLYSLHQHRQLGTALWKALAVEAEAHDHHYYRPHRTLLDSDVLLEEFAGTADMLVQGLDQRVIAREAAPRELSVQERLRERQRDAAPEMDESAGGGISIGGEEPLLHGTRTLPIFLLSLKSAPRGLQMDVGGVVAASHNGAIVLQMVPESTGGLVDSGHVMDGAPVWYQAHDPTPHLVAALAAVLGGLPAPYQHAAAPLAQGVAEEWLWAVGYHPFGPYAVTPALSAALVNSAARNRLVSQIDAALKQTRAVQAALQDYLDLVPQCEILKKSSKVKAVASSLTDVVGRQQSALEVMFVDLSRLLYEGSLEQAEKLSGRLLAYADALQAYVEGKLEPAREWEVCCVEEVQRVAAARSGLSGWLVRGAGLGAVLAAVAWLVQKWRRRRPAKRTRNTIGILGEIPMQKGPGRIGFGVAGRRAL